MRKSTRNLLGAVALPVAMAATGLPALRAACGPCRPKASNPCSPCAAKKAKKSACNPCNPCAAKKKCNPCAAKKACAPCNPCAAKKNPCAAKNPCGAKNPCAAANPCNPCGAGDMPAPKAAEVTRPAGSKPFQGDRAALVELGKKLYADTSLSTNETSCASCHTDGAMFMDSFKKPYPHQVQMAKEVSNMDTITAEGMVQYCLIRPMMSKPLAWDSKELAALTAYVEDVQKDHSKK